MTAAGACKLAGVQRGRKSAHWIFPRDLVVVELVSRCSLLVGRRDGWPIPVLAAIDVGESTDEMLTFLHLGRRRP